MHIAITTVTMGANGTLHVADHREGHACVTREVLPEAQAGSRDALVAALDLLQLSRLRPEAVHTGVQILDAMDVHHQLDKTCAGEISKKRPGGRNEHRRELRQSYGLHPTAEIDCRSPH